LQSTALRRALVGSSIVWALLLPLAPFAASQPAPAHLWYVLGMLIYGAGSVVCHQLPERSFILWSAQWPVCARCTGIYAGAAVAAIFATVRLKRIRLRPDTTQAGFTSQQARLMLAVAAAPTALTLAYEWTTGTTPSNAVRALSGAPLGAAIGLIIVGALRDPDARQASRAGGI